MADKSSPLYLGFDLSTQQLKSLAVNSDLKAEYQVKFDFDTDSRGFNNKKGVLTDEAENEVFAPLGLWLQAIDAVLQKLRDDGMDFSRVRGISGAGMQHGSVYWSQKGEQALESLDSSKSLEAQLREAFSHPYSPNWQDASTQSQCDEFDKHLGDETQLAVITGSKAHHRFTGPQILRFRMKYPERYEQTSRICLVSSFLASIFLGRIAPFDISDVCGMNLWDIKASAWHEQLLSLTAGSSDTSGLKRKLGAASLPEDGGAFLGNISPYFVERYDFDDSCAIAPSTGDNPSTILALPLRPLDAIVSLGTSTTYLMGTPHYKPNPAHHLMNHPTTAGLYMFMLCYKNGGLAREQVRDSLSPPEVSELWQKFDQVATASPPLGQSCDPSSPMKLGLFFPRPEIVPNVRAGTWRFIYKPRTGALMTADGMTWNQPEDDVRAIVESQFLSLRLRSKDLVESPTGPNAHLPPQPRRIYLVGGGSRNAAIAKIAGEVLGGWEGVYRLDVGENACALGAAYKAVWAVERSPGESFEELIGGRWKETEFVEKIAEGYQEGIFERYGLAVEGLDMVEKEVLKAEKNQ
ncbi:MAG: hypothetical protein LQ343_006900 [Gyalolechia ehrenbergii]|nr:MAG: hypothetical protein LQ343_006900 [Gyalolechia ehrenbergii]